MKLPELLAPAGSPEALKAAVAAGADAVYLSGKRFGARKFAANFDERELKEAVDYTHLRGVKVYVTVNTLVRDDELPEVARYLLWLYQTGVDAVLVQDIGVAALARRIVPDMDLHASTQMTIHNRAGAVWAEKLGMKRVVLAREVSLQEAEEIARGLNIGLEVFVHGALSTATPASAFSLRLLEDDPETEACAPSRVANPMFSSAGRRTSTADRSTWLLHP